MVQLTAKILDRGKPIKLRTREGEVDAETIIREVNNSSDIARILGTTLAPPDSNDYQVRLKATETAFETPKFKLVGGTQVSTQNAQTYSVELRKRPGGKGDLKPIQPVNESGLAFASIDVGETYVVVLCNYDEKADAVAKLEIDGLDAANTFNTDKAADGKQLTHQGYFVPRAKNGKPGEHLVPGWLHTLKPGNDNTFDFVVNELGKGAATQLKVRGSTGIVTVRFFDACEENETPRSRSFGETGVGQARKQDYSLKSAKIGTEPAAIISIRYSRQP